MNLNFLFTCIAKGKGRTVRLLKDNAKTVRVVKPRKTYEALPIAKRRKYDDGTWEAVDPKGDADMMN